MCSTSSVYVHACLPLATSLVQCITTYTQDTNVWLCLTYLYTLLFSECQNKVL